MDIPLREVQIIWEPQRDGVPPVRVMGLRDRDDPDYFASWGACNNDFNQEDDAGRLTKLFQQFHQLVVLYRIDPQAVHEALMVIPEYRANIAVDLDPRRHEDDD